MLDNPETTNTLARSGRNPTRAQELSAEYHAVRSATERLCEDLSIEDFVVQSMPDASPVKWHLAHTTWFFETFVLAGSGRTHRDVLPEGSYLFNSYYNLIGPMHARDKRGLLTRPTVNEVSSYRAAIDLKMGEMMHSLDDKDWHQIAPVIQLGLNHEQQHQELILTDVKHLFAQNPLRPAYRNATNQALLAAEVPPLGWVEFEEGIYHIGHTRNEEFCFDNEMPAHRQFLERFSLGSRLVTNAEYMAFMEDGGYERPELWLAAGWDAAKQGGWNAPLYWEWRDGGGWRSYDLSGMRRIENAEPVCHVSYFEADAYARWADARLPSEAEWEAAAAHLACEGNFVDSGVLHPVSCDALPGIRQMFGDVWEWTASSYAPYPGYKPAPGALGEYNGKFMCNQYVLRGGSCATPRSHIRATYRNFFPPDKRWQFTGIRLAKNS
jgi:ergothioneine biosynthesis protein EgtB